MRRFGPLQAAPRLVPDPHAALLGEILAASVCHGTNWDRLRRAIAGYAATGSAFTAHELAALELPQFRGLLGHGFGEGSLVTRHRLFTETAKIIASGAVLQLDDLLGGEIRVGGRQGLYERLGAIPAFAGDPEAKKARILVQELCRTRLITPSDPEAVRPAIEYHLIRLYLRTERVVPVRRYDELRLHARTTFRAPVIMRIRRAVEDAMYFSAAAAEIPVSDLNFLEWQVARSFCERSGPRCGGPPRADKPCDPAVLSLSDGPSCPFSAGCRAARDERLAGIVEPQLSDRYDYY